MRTLAFIALVAAAAAAPARAGTPAHDASFESVAAGAEHVQRLEDLVWALTATCRAGDDIEQRQCRHVRDVRAAELARETLVIDAEPGALQVGAWDAQRRSVSLRLTACIRCTGITIDGATWRLAGGVPHAEDGTLHGALLYDGAQTFPDEAAAKAWIASLAGARIELVLKLSGPPHDVPAPTPMQVIAFDVLGYRVVTPCDGGIVLAKPASSPLAPEPAACRHHPVKVEK